MPCAIDSRGCVILITAYNFVDQRGLRPINENGAILDQGLVGEGVVGDEDLGARADREGDDGTILGMNTFENWFDL